jgi:hypothetical protein
MLRTREPGNSASWCPPSGRSPPFPIPRQLLSQASSIACLSRDVRLWRLSHSTVGIIKLSVIGNNLCRYHRVPAIHENGFVCPKFGQYVFHRRNEPNFSLHRTRPHRLTHHPHHRAPKRTQFCALLPAPYSWLLLFRFPYPNSPHSDIMFPDSIGPITWLQ